MTKAKQWILTVILTAIAVSALFFGIMLSEPVYTTAQAQTLNATLSNGLLDEQQSTTDHEAVPYDIEDWQFGSINVPSYPRLRYGEETRAESDEGIVTFTLSRANDNGSGSTTLTSGNEPRSHWNQYFNRFIPAGRYTVTFSYSAVAIDDISGVYYWWNNSSYEQPVTCAEGSVSIEFEVKRATLVVTVNELDGYTDSMSFASLNTGSIGNLFRAANTRTVTYDYISKDTAREGLWANLRYDSFYDTPKYVFNLLRMRTNDYYAANDAYWTTNYDKLFNEADEFTVFYRILFDRNYETYPAAEDKYEHFFTVQAAKTIKVPSIVSRSFVEGKNQSPVFDYDENGKYYDLVNPNATYRNAGTYQVDVKIRDQYQSFISWENGSSATVQVPFVITQLANYWNVTPTMVSWNYLNFKQEINGITEEVAHGQGEIRHTIFALNENGVRTGVRYSDQELSRLPIGSYELETTFVAAPNSNYSSIPNTVTTFAVLPTVNYWDRTPLTGWTYGNDPTEDGALKALAHASLSAQDRYEYSYYKQAIASSAVAPDTSREYTLAEIKDANGNVPAGTYWVRVKFIPASDQTYGGLDTNFQVVVSRAANGWTTTPSIDSWAVGGAQNTPVGQAKFGSVSFVITDRLGREMYTANNWVRSCQAGWYTLTATVEATNDYEGATVTKEFRVFPATDETRTSVEATASVNNETVNVRLTAGLVEGTTLSAEFMSVDDATYKSGKTILENNNYVCGSAFTLGLTFEEGAVTPDGIAEVRITIPGELKDKAGLQVVGIGSDGAVEALGSRVNADGTITFRTNNLGAHYFVYSNNEGSTGVGFIIAIIAIVVVALVLVVVALVLVRRSRKEEAAVAAELSDDE